MITINSLDPSQKNTLKAILDAKKEDDIFLVYGPPGTGKSQLVVSLLYELAVQGKRILFVSQNTEALQVIDRMIIAVEKDINYQSGNNLSLKSFCLNLYSGEHRYLRHIRAQYTRLLERSLPTLHSIEEIKNPASYPLGYIHLDRIKNYKNDGEKVGIDEMLTYFIQYVSEELMVESLQNFQNIDLRKVLNFINSYELKDKFYFYVAPQNELRYISSTNFEIKFDQLHSALIPIKELAAKAEADTKIKVKREISVIDYLSLLQSYYNASKFLNVYFVLSKNISISEMQQQFDKAIQLSKQLLDSDDQIKGLIAITEPMSVEKDYVSQLDKDFKKFDADIIKIKELITKLTQLIKKTELINLHDFIILSVKTYSLESGKLVKLFPEIQKFNANEINELISSAEAFENLSKFVKPFSSLPNIFKDKLKISSKSAPQIIIKNKIALDKISKILGNTNYAFKTLLKLQKENPKTNIKALNLFQNISQDILEYILVDSFILLELLSLYKINDQQKLRDIQEIVSKINKDNHIYEIAKEANSDKIIQLHTAEFISSVNKTIKHQNATEEIHLILETYRDSISNVNDFNSFIDILPNLLLMLEGSKTLFEDINLYLDVPVENIKPSNLSSLSLLKEQLVTVESMNIYSSAFSTLNSGQNIASWFASISHLSFFNNINEFDNYITHNKLIHQLGLDLGVNKPWLDRILSTSNLTYEYFAARIVNTIVRSAFQHLNPSERPSIGNKFFSQYHDQLIAEKYDYYIKGLSTIRNKILAAAQTLSNPNNWQVATTTMEKIRNNTQLISQAYPIIAATPKDVAKFLKAEKEIFDYVIFDEASQLLPGQAIPSIFRAKHAVIIGDPHQMPPILTASIGGLSLEDDDEDLEIDESILDLVRKQPQNQFHLKVHYRSESNMLFEPSRTAIYREDGIEPIYEAKFSAQAPIAIEDNLGYDDTPPQKGDNKSEKGKMQPKKYDQNFSKICEHIQNYLNQDTTATFCILFTRAEDLYSFKDFLTENEKEYKLIFDRYIDGVILLSTVSNCQGIEGIYSILYLRHYDMPGGMWFFKENAGAYKRLNVSITRQRRALTILMADSKEKWLQVCESKLANMSTGPNARKSAELLRSLLTNAGEVIDATYLDRTLSNNVLRFDSPLTEQLYIKLVDYYKSKIGKELKIYCEVGWHIRIPNTENITQDEKNIGFRIDIGIYSVRKKEFILGIEMDGATYHSGYDRQHSDYSRQEVLTKKGWDLFRIWSTNWLHDQKAEFKRLTQYIDNKIEATTS